MSRGLGKLQQRVLGALANSQGNTGTLYSIKCALWGKPEMFWDAFGERHKTYGATWRNPCEYSNVKRALHGLVERGQVHEVFLDRYAITETGKAAWENLPTHLIQIKDVRPKRVISPEVQSVIWKAKGHEKDIPKRTIPPIGECPCPFQNLSLKCP